MLFYLFHIHFSVSMSVIFFMLDFKPTKLLDKLLKGHVKSYRTYTCHNILKHIEFEKHFIPSCGLFDNFRLAYQNTLE